MVSSLKGGTAIMPDENKCFMHFCCGVPMSIGKDRPINHPSIHGLILECRQAVVDLECLLVIGRLVSPHG